MVEMIVQKREELLQQISNGKIKKTISDLLTLKDADISQKEVLAIAAQFKRLTEKRQMGTLSHDQMQLEENQIVARLIEVLSSENGLQNTARLKGNIWQDRKYTITTAILGVLTVLVFLIFFNKSKSAMPLQLTIFVSDAQGRVILENTGELVVNGLGNDRRTAAIGEKGRTNFGEIPAKFHGSELTIGFDVEGFEIVDGKNTFLFTGEPIYLEVKRDDSLGFIKGVVKGVQGQDFIAEAWVRINNDTLITTNALGVFEISLPEQMRVNASTESYNLTIGKAGYKTVTQYYYPKSSDIEVRLENQ